MNKKIYFNNNFVEFVELASQSTQNQLIEFDKNSTSAFEIFLTTQFLNEKNVKNYTMLALNFENVLDYFKNAHYYIEAAGGLIEKNNSFLFIKRLGKWDLPKGKIEKNEAIEEAAIRECEEECNIDELIIEKTLPSTFHIYPYKKSYALKQTYWYRMISTSSKLLAPQLKEQITEVIWFTKQNIKNEVLKNTYLTIKDVLTEINHD